MPASPRCVEASPKTLGAARRGAAVGMGDLAKPQQLVRREARLPARLTDCSPQVERGQST